ncbi:hypothetical protein [Pelosinus baikalensis]|uniref:Uncharacterized protein n=1 Tax=Pelosinus baikalensis TaxID=2892015 RepID=A0ABS8HZV9_9FIRM|nr:hypothetical protein [Pelosinus baikalensis]MCC5468693.1 hypothetical protein [Pelosinus baikalensis]
MTIPTILVIIHNGSEEELLHQENSPLFNTLPKDIEDLAPNFKIAIDGNTYAVIAADTEPKLDREMNVVGTYVILRVE